MARTAKTNQEPEQKVDPCAVTMQQIVAFMQQQHPDILSTAMLTIRNAKLEQRVKELESKEQAND